MYIPLIKLLPCETTINQHAYSSYNAFTLCYYYKSTCIFSLKYFYHVLLPQIHMDILFLKYFYPMLLPHIRMHIFLKILLTCVITTNPHAYFSYNAFNLWYYHKSIWIIFLQCSYPVLLPQIHMHIFQNTLSCVTTRSPHAFF